MKCFVDSMTDNELLVGLSYLAINSLSCVLVFFLILIQFDANSEGRALIDILLMVATAVILLSSHWFKLFCQKMICKYQVS